MLVPSAFVGDVAPSVEPPTPDVVPTGVDDVALHEIYLPHFRRVIDDEPDMEAVGIAGSGVMPETNARPVPTQQIRLFGV